MSKQQKDKGKGWEAFLRYQQDGLSDEERHAIEREVEKDPFVAEAMEGLSSVDPDEAQADLASLQRMVRKRTAVRSNRIWYAAAATIAVLAVIGTLYLTVFSERIGRMDSGIAESAQETQAGESATRDQASETEPLTGSEDTGRMRDESQEEPQEQPARPAAQTTTEPEQDMQPRSTETAAGTGLDETPTEVTAGGNAGEEADAERVEGPPAPEDIVSEMEVVEEERVEGPPAPEDIVSEMEVAEEERVEGPPTPEELETGREELAYQAAEADMEDINVGGTEQGAAERAAAPGSATKSAARSTVDMTAVSDETGDALTTDRPAIPVGGMEAYRSYIRENLQFPQTDMSITSAEVSLNFVLNESGMPADIQILESPGEAFSREAVRLLENGPPWEPALSSGAETRERIPFTVVFER